MKIKQIILLIFLFTASVSVNATLNHSTGSTYCVDDTDSIHLMINWEASTIGVNGDNYHKIAKIGKFGKRSEMISTEKYISSNGDFSYFIIFSTPNGVFVDIRNAATNRHIANTQLFCRTE